MESGEYLPEMLRDFHDQKDLFKKMHSLYGAEQESYIEMPNWVSGQCYVIDWFLWYMGQRGYVLRKSRAKIDFKKFQE